MAAEVINAGRAGTSTATAGAAETSGTAGTDTSASAAQTVGLTCHGGAGAAPGPAGLAVNARRREPPDRLRAELACTLSGLAAYPDPAPAARAVTARHGRRAGEVLLTAGRAHLTRLPGTVPGVEVGGNQRAPFALIHVADGLRVREGLGRRGFAVWRVGTFPGLGPDWLRIAARETAASDAFAHSLREALSEELT